MKRMALPALVGIVLILCIAPAHAVEILRWERLPLAVPLMVGQERVVFIERNVRIGVPAELGDQLRVQSAAGAIYLLANAPVPPTRLQLQDVETGALVLLDIAATSAKAGQPPLEPIRIVFADALPQSRNTAAARDIDASAGMPDAEQRTSDAPGATPIPIVLTRYAAQNLYAPLRTVEPVAGIGRVNLQRELDLESLLPTLPVRARALAAWRLEDQWVTAIRLSNTSSRWIELDPRVLQGDFLTATFQHPDLGPVGDSTDTTMLYLVTRGHGLAESLLPALSRFDAAMNLPPAAAAGQVEGARDEK
ncbi:TIGR03749 family integrating conjugative element protein [Chitinimonas koreensis]|uniref:TIGR03749 family integrating conjugative element protein n=1 Tax=Chitinimonas koreensis TaxID=356302 RepID=UPI000421C894|nr:TIGR03749 family integrating conjugative element protein [Chitinimonas koreensis]QNM96710.1 TIGR03749 family integrating conjugative element protein [Chitinimonas koreensis]